MADARRTTSRHHATAEIPSEGQRLFTPLSNSSQARRQLHVARWGWVCAISNFGVFILLWLTARPRNSAPLLSGPPEFLILAIVVAFGAYLRQINFQAEELRHRIKHGDVWRYPPETQYAQDKMAVLARTSQIVRETSPFMIVLAVLVCGRIVMDGFARIWCESGHYWPIFYALDVAIALSLLFAFSGLAFAHFRTRRSDAKIEEVARPQEKSNLLRSQRKSRELTGICEALLSIANDTKEKTTL